MIFKCDIYTCFVKKFLDSVNLRKKMHFEMKFIQ